MVKESSFVIKIIFNFFYKIGNNFSKRIARTDGTELECVPARAREREVSCACGFS